jgi:PEP-CTERM motif
MFKTLAAAAALVAFLPAHADTLAQWTFETSVPTTAGPLAPEVGSGSASGFHAAATTYSNPTGNGSAESFSSNNWLVGDYYQFVFSTLGFSGLTVSFDQTSSGTGPRDFSLAYSTDGNSFTSLQGYTVLANAAPNPTWSSATYQPIYTLSFDLSALTALDNQASVFIRMVQTSTVSANGGVVASGGTNRVDNFLAMSSPVPEPGSLALLLAGTAVVGFVARRQRR